MAAHTVDIDVIDKSALPEDHSNIPVINQPNPCYGYSATAKEVYYLMHFAQYCIYESGTNNIINGNTYLDYFPEEGGGGGGGNYSVTVLWDYTTDNSGTIPYAPFIGTLNDNINNYDAIQLEMVSYEDDLDTSRWYATVFSPIIPVYALNNSFKNNYFIFTSFETRSTNWYIKDTTVQKVATNLSDTNGLVRVYGIKF